MTVSTFDPGTALLVVDLQRGTIGSVPMAHPAAHVVARAAELVAAFRRHSRPVVLVTNLGGAAGRTTYGGGAADWPSSATELVAGLDPQPSDLRVAKRGWGAFAGNDLDARLRALGVTQVVVAGVATSYGVESTAREAYDAGYHVLLAVDAMTDPTPEGHEHSLTRVFPALGRLATTAEIVALLDAGR